MGTLKINWDQMGTKKLILVPMGTKVPKWGPTWEQCLSPCGKRNAEKSRLDHLIRSTNHIHLYLPLLPHWSPFGDFGPHGDQNEFFGPHLVPIYFQSPHFLNFRLKNASKVSAATISRQKYCSNEAM